MSKSSNTKSVNTRGRPRVKIGKSRQNITMDPAILKTAKKMACAEGLFLSTWLERLVRSRIDNAAQS